MVRHGLRMTLGLLVMLALAATHDAWAQTQKAPVKFTPQEVKQAVKTFFEKNGFGYKDVQITSLSKPMTLPKSYVLAQVIPMKAYSVSFMAKTTFGSRKMDNWFVMLTRRDGKPVVQGYFNDEARIKKQLGKDGPEWYQKNHVKAPDVHG